MFNGPGTFNADAILQDWGSPWDIVQPGVGIKQYPCCGSTHSAVDAMFMLIEEHGLTPAQVELVESWTHPRRLAHTDRPEPNTELEAKFSVQYCLARALMSRAVSWNTSAMRAFTSRKSARCCGACGRCRIPKRRVTPPTRSVPSCG